MRSASIILEDIITNFYGKNVYCHTPSDLERIPNAILLFEAYGVTSYEDMRVVLLSSDEQSDNIRDYVSWLAEYMGGFVMADKDGKFHFSLFEDWHSLIFRIFSRIYLKSQISGFICILQN